MSFGSCFGQTFFISIFAAHIMADYGLTHGDWGRIYGTGTLASGLLMIWAGGLADKFRVRTLAVAVLSILTAFCVWMATNTALWALPFIIFGLRFAGQGMLFHIGMVAMARWFAGARGRAIAIAQLGFSVGEAFLPLIFALLLPSYLWRTLWMIPATLAIVMIPLSLWLLKQERTPQSLAASDISTGMNGRQWTRNMAIKHWLIWSLAPLIMGPSAFSTAFFFLQVHFAQTKGITHEALTALFPIFTIATIGFALCYGWAVDKFGATRLLPLIGIPWVFGFLAMFVADGYGMMILGFICMALAQGGNGTVLVAFWSEVYGTKHLGSIKAFATAIMVIGSAVGPALTGYFIDKGTAFVDQMPLIAGYFVISTAITFVAVHFARRTLLPQPMHASQP